MNVWLIAASVGTVLAYLLLVRLNRAVSNTTLVATKVWIVLIVVIWTVALVSDLLAHSISAAQADHLWHAAAVLALCPPICVLGARRPGTRVWTWFILVPMLLVLGWPIATIWLLGSELRGLHLETPQLGAFCLVLIMGIGNYCGTRYTIATLVYGASVVLLVLCTATLAPAWMADRSMIRILSTLLMFLAAYLITSASRPLPKSRFDRVWFDFFDTFGIVWGRRIQDRINFLVQKERLPVHLELDGFAWNSSLLPAGSQTENSENSLQPVLSDLSNQTSTAVEARLEHILRWLLRRFVDSSWIDVRLGSTSIPNESRFMVDS